MRWHHLHRDAFYQSEPTVSHVAPTISEVPSTNTDSDKKVYDGWLPIGHEPLTVLVDPQPPHGARTPPRGRQARLSRFRRCTGVAELKCLRTWIAQLASTIDNLALVSSLILQLQKTPKTSWNGQADLTGLASRIETIKHEERQQLEKTLDEQAKEYTTKLLELEMRHRINLTARRKVSRKFLTQRR